MRKKYVVSSISSSHRPVRLAYQPLASSTFLSDQISHQQPASSTLLSEQTSTSHQPPANRTGCMQADASRALMRSRWSNESSQASRYKQSRQAHEMWCRSVASRSASGKSSPPPTGMAAGRSSSRPYSTTTVRCICAHATSMQSACSPPRRYRSAPHLRARTPGARPPAPYSAAAVRLQLPW
jgi:hypothetical protein